MKLLIILGLLLTFTNPSIAFLGIGSILVGFGLAQSMLSQFSVLFIIGGIVMFFLS